VLHSRAAQKILSGKNGFPKGYLKAEVQRASVFVEKQGGFIMLRLTMSTEEYLMIGDNVRIVFLGGSKNHLRIMVDAPKEVDVVRSRVIENKITDEELRAKLPHFYAEPEIPQKFRKPKNVVMTDNRRQEKNPSLKNR